MQWGSSLEVVLALLFVSPFGTFQYIRMPFGLANAGSVYSRMLDVAMDKVEHDFWTSYLDDILTFCTAPQIHFGHLNQVVRAHAAAGIKIQPCKSKLFQSEVEYLGHKISRKGVEMIPDYVKKVTSWPVPTSGNVPGICRILQIFHSSVLSANQQVKRDQES